MRLSGEGAVLLAVLGLAASLVLAVLVDSSSAQGGGLEIEVVNCPPDAPPDDPDCQTETTEVGQRPPKEGGGGGGNGPRQPAGSEGDEEVHDISLGSGDRLTRGGGKESATLDLAKEKGPGGAYRKPDKRQPEIERVKSPDAGGGVARPNVSTKGGSPFGGLGTQFDFVSSDEALSSFSIPPALLPVYISAGRAYGVPWNVLASINRIESDFCRLSDLVSSAGAVGCMQFLPSTWKAYGVDASGDGIADPYNPVDSVYAAARYLAASGAAADLRRAVFAYNHANWYVDEVLGTASVYGSLPPGLVAETGSLAFGHFPVRGEVVYGDDFREAQEEGRRPRGLRIFPRERAIAVATQNVTVRRVLLDRGVAKAFRAGKEPLPGGRAPRDEDGRVPALLRKAIEPLAGLLPLADPLTEIPIRRSLYLLTLVRALSSPPVERQKGRLPDGYAISSKAGVGVEVEDALGNRYRYEGLRELRETIRPGARLRGAEAIGSLPADRDKALLFSIRGAGGAPIDPRVMVDGYRLQEAAGYYHAVAPLGGNPFLPDASYTASGVIKGTDKQLARRVLSDPGINVYPCGREEIAKGIVDRRVLTTLLVLRKAGMTLTVTSLRCGHGFYTSSGNVSAHSFGAAVDIAAFNGQPVLGHQGPGSLTEQAIKILISLEGEARPAQLISLMSLGGPSFAMADHADHLHVGYAFDASLGLGRSGKALGPVSVNAGLEAPEHGKAAKAQEEKLSERLGEIENPQVSRKRSAAGVPVEGETPADRRAAERTAERDFPFELLPTASGAEMIDVAVPEGARGDEAYGIGIVDGTARGWERRQTVILAHHGGMWRIAGPPRDKRGQVVNSELYALDVARGGRGYAVGERGAVVEVRGTRSPRVLRSPVETALRDVAVAGKGGSGYAVGAKGTVLRLSDERVEREPSGGAAPDLSAVTVEPGGTAVAVGTESDRQPVLYERHGSWREAALGFASSGDTAIRLTEVASDGDELWLGGAIADSRTAGTPGELPFAASRVGGRWTTYCSATPALANIRELGRPSERPCDEGLVLDPSERGPVTGVAITDQGTVVATGRGLHLLGKSRDSFRPVSVAPLDVSSLELVSDGRGWTVGSGRMTRIVSGGGGSSAKRLVEPPMTTRLPLPGSGLPAAVAVAPGGDRALAFGGGGSSRYEVGRWRKAGATGLSVRDAVWVGDEALAIDDTGGLLTYRAGEWSAAGENVVESRVREALADVVGGQPLLPRDDREEASGLHALAAGSELEAYAVGAEGRIERYLVGGWEQEDSPVDVTLRDVAAGLGGVVAVGERGTLLEREDGDWDQVPEVRFLVDGQDFSAVTALADGGFVAVAGGSIVERRGADGEWRSAPLPPLGLPVERLAAYRDRGERLHVVAQARSGEQPVLLEGTEAGWRPLELGDGTAVGDFAPEPGSEAIWVVGTRDGQQVATKLELGGETKEER